MNLKKVTVVAKYTFLETIKSKLLLNIVFLACALAFISYIASSLTYGAPEKIALDVGLGLTSIATKVIAIFYGVGIIQQEIETRTIYLVLSRPVRKVEYFFGRLSGLSLMLLLNVFLVGGFALISYLFLGGMLTTLMLWTLFFTFFEALLLLLLVVICALFCSKVLAILLSITFYVAGYIAQDLLTSNTFVREGFFQPLLKLATLVLPNFSRLNLKDFLLYEQTLPQGYISSSTWYAIIFIIAFLIIGSILINKKSLD